MGNSMLKKRRPTGRLPFNIGVDHILIWWDVTIFILKRGPGNHTCPGKACKVTTWNWGVSAFIWRTATCFHVNIMTEWWGTLFKCIIKILLFELVPHICCVFDCLYTTQVNYIAPKICFFFSGYYEVRDQCSWKKWRFIDNCACVIQFRNISVGHSRLGLVLNL